MKKRNKDWLLAEWLGKRHATQGGRDRHPQHGLRRGERNYYALHRERGKSRVLVRGAKKVKSRHAALIQLFTVGEFVFLEIMEDLGH